jgi:hypothetical protein
MYSVDHVALGLGTSTSITAPIELSRLRHVISSERNEPSPARATPQRGRLPYLNAPLTVPQVFVSDGVGCTGRSHACSRRRICRLLIQICPSS